MTAEADAMKKEGYIKVIAFYKLSVKAKNMLKQTDILGAVKKKLKEIVDLPVYLDEVVENYQSPCFFLKLMKKTEPDNVQANRLLNKCLLLITYFAEKGINEAADLYDIKDAITQAFWRGLEVKTRYIMFLEITSETEGDDADIIYMELPFNYYDSDKEDDVDKNGDPIKIMRQIHHKERIKGTKQYHCNGSESEDIYGEINDADSGSSI